jgi:hypothetical protein
MITVRMVQPAVYEIVDMVAMRDHFMSAVWAVRMCAVYLRRAGHGICCIDRDDMFVDVILVSVVGMVFLGASGHRQYSLLALGLPCVLRQTPR